MTECERIIEQGILPESFFKEEERCGFLVTEKRKKIWAVELDIYLKFAEVCKQHNLTFWVDGGTLLGAIRHNGFIPWDDDLDVVMPRKDYNKLMEISTWVFNKPYFLQTPHTDPNSGYSFAKLRNSNTTCIPKMFAKARFNHGIHIDIFPLDYWEENAFEEYEIIKALNIENSTYMRMTNPNLDERNRERVKNYSGRNPIETYEEIHQRAQQFNSIKSKFVTAAVSTILSYKKKLWYAEDFSSSIMADFEGYKVSIPIGYDRILKTVFGDYMSFPSIEERGLHHNGVLFDADKPYTEYLIN